VASVTPVNTTVLSRTTAHSCWRPVGKSQHPSDSYNLGLPMGHNKPPSDSAGTALVTTAYHAGNLSGSRRLAHVLLRLSQPWSPELM